MDSDGLDRLPAQDVLGPPKSKKGLLDLPAELRNCIYEELLSEKGSRRPNIIAVCRTIKIEAESVLYAQLDLRFCYDRILYTYTCETTVGPIEPFSDTGLGVGLAEWIKIWEVHRHTLRKFRRAKVVFDGLSAGTRPIEDYPSLGNVPTESGKVFWFEIARLLYIPFSILASSEFIHQVTLDINIVPPNKDMTDSLSTIVWLLRKFSPQVRIRIQHATTRRFAEHIEPLLVLRNPKNPCWDWIRLKEKLVYLLKISPTQRLVMAKHVMEGVGRNIPHTGCGTMWKDEGVRKGIRDMARFVTLTEYRRIGGSRGCFKEVLLWARPL